MKENSKIRLSPSETFKGIFFKATAFSDKTAANSAVPCHPGLLLQKSIGNRAVDWLIQAGVHPLKQCDRNVGQPVKRVKGHSRIPNIQRQMLFPVKPQATKMKPLVIKGGLINDELPRASGMVEADTTIEDIANKVLPLFNKATPYSKPDGGKATPPPLTKDELAKALLVFNQFYLPVKTMVNFKAGFRFPLPVRITFTGEWLVHPIAVRNLAETFKNAWLPLLRQAPQALTAPANMADQVRQFLGDHSALFSRGIHLQTRIITNPAETLPFVREVFNQLGAGGLTTALAVMDHMVNHQVALLASLREGHEILRILHGALQAVSTPLSREQVQSRDRALAMLAPFAVPGITVNPAAVQPRGTGGISTSKVTITGVAPGTRLTPTVTAAANSGGHQHAGRRPVGTISPATKIAGRSGRAEFTYRSNAPGGIETISVNVGGTVVQQNIEVRVPNLLELQAGVNYDLVGQTANHADNHFGTAATNTSLQQIANDYEAHKQGHGLNGWPRVAYNDISLASGGIFDIHGNWRAPHNTHRVGNTVDFRTRHLSAAQLRVLRGIIRAAGGVILNEGDHWHLTF